MRAHGPSAGNSLALAALVALLALARGSTAQAQEVTTTAASPSPEPEADLERLLEAAELWGLSPGVVLLSDASQRRAALREVDAIDQQIILGHVLGALSAAAGGAGYALIFSQWMTRCDHCDSHPEIEVAGVLLGVAALTGLGIAIGLHVDARSRWGRWDVMLGLASGAVALRF